LILFTTAVSYVSAIIIEKTDNKRRKKFWLAMTLITSLGVLFFFKYFNFLADSAVSLWNLFGGEADFIALKLILPVGISFYTFQTLSYVIDVYRGDIKAERHFGWYALFVSFFPQLVAGPIERPDNLLPQLKATHKLEADNAFAGLQKMAIGFFKKIVVADTVAEYVNAVYNNPTDAKGLAIIIATLLFAVQIYCDFSGYTDIAIGCARIMGYRLMQNFDRPYSAQNIRDFWARWHISLSSWFKDYLYIPLGGNRKGYARQLVNLFIVFLVSGLWHGAEWTFILWGLLHGIYRVVGDLTYKKRNTLYAKAGLDIKSKGVVIFRTAVTFILVCFAWIFFRANNTADLLILLRNLFTTFGATTLVTDLGLTINNAIIVILAIFIMILCDRKLTLKQYQRASGAQLLGGTSVYLIWAIMFAWLILLAAGGSSAFIYFQF
jgi:D-alanyl-lipoteichoic acid acyltransferase DltB (MBOAT superfamily)